MRSQVDGAAEPFQGGAAQGADADAGPADAHDLGVHLDRLAIGPRQLEMDDRAGLLAAQAILEQEPRARNVADAPQVASSVRELHGVEIDRLAPDASPIFEGWTPES